MTLVLHILSVVGITIGSLFFFYLLAYINGETCRWCKHRNLSTNWSWYCEHCGKRYRKL